MIIRGRGDAKIAKTSSPQLNLLRNLSKQYVGETGRSLSERAQEYLKVCSLV